MWRDQAGFGSCWELCSSPIPVEIGLLYGPWDEFFQQGWFLVGCRAVWSSVVVLGSKSERALTSNVIRRSDFVFSAYSQLTITSRAFQWLLFWSFARWLTALNHFLFSPTLQLSSCGFTYYAPNPTIVSCVVHAYIYTIMYHRAHLAVMTTQFRLKIWVEYYKQGIWLAQSSSLIRAVMDWRFLGGPSGNVKGRRANIEGGMAGWRHCHKINFLWRFTWLAAPLQQYETRSVLSMARELLRSLIIWSSWKFIHTCLIQIYVFIPIFSGWI